MTEKLLNPMYARRKEWYKTESGRACRNRIRQRYYEKTNYSRNHRKKWTEAEELLVLMHRESDAELSAKLGRSVHAIQGKRIRLKKKLGYTE